MANLILVTGGARSGKSGFARQRASCLEEPRTFIATCPVLDQEMAERVEHHKREREGEGWDTIEEEIDLANAVRRAGKGTVLVDCLTLWVNNLMYRAEGASSNISEDDVAAKSRDVLKAVEDVPGNLIFVTNEVGLGVSPENTLARRFRDYAGRCNQIFAASARDMVCMVSGLPMVLKKDGVPTADTTLSGKGYYQKFCEK